MAVAGRNGRDRGRARAESSFERQQAWGLTKKIQHSPPFSPTSRPYHVPPAQRRHSRFYLTGRSISVDNVITTFRRPKELSGTTIGPRVTNDAESLRSSPVPGPGREKIRRPSRIKYTPGEECAATIRLSKCRNKSAYCVSA